MTRWLARLAFVIAALAMLGGAGLVWLRMQLEQPGPALAQQTLLVPRGNGLTEIAEQMQEAGLIRSPWLLIAEAWLTGKTRLQAGEYAFPPKISMAAALEMMAQGHVVIRRVTVPEGLSTAEILELLRDTDGLQGKIPARPDEGSLLPETYHYNFGDSRDALLNRMHKGMVQLLDEQWSKRDPDSPLTNKIEALILASIVEKETARSTERPHIAAVFLNRLRRHMKLQSDPTVIYGLTLGEEPLGRSLTRDDLLSPSPYNTYYVEGLPIGPICNPGKASLNAVLHPDESDDLYFVADGSGGHAFAATLSEHNRNVSRWRALQAGGRDAAPAGTPEESSPDAPPPLKPATRKPHPTGKAKHR